MKLMLTAADSIVAVTGLSGNAYGSWKTRLGNYLWLEDYLPNDLEHPVRVTTYGYNTTLTEPTKRTDSLDGLVEDFVVQLSNFRSIVSSIHAPPLTNIVGIVC